MVMPKILKDKNCFVYCGPEHCDCINGNPTEGAKMKVKDKPLTMSVLIMLRDHIVQARLMQALDIQDGDTMKTVLEAFHDDLDVHWIKQIEKIFDANTAKKLKEFCETPLDLS